MPGSVVTATVSEVMPFELFTKFSLQIQRKANVNEYSDGAMQSGALVGSERRRWDIAQRLSASELTSLFNFYVAQNGKQLPFYIYDVTLPGVNWDATGILTTGRYPVRFDTDQWSHAVQIGRADTPFSFIEIA